MREADVAPAVVEDPDAAEKPAALTSRITGSLARRMIAIAALWISVLLIGGGFALDRVLTGAITRNFDSSLEYVLIAMIRSSEIGPDGEVRLVEPLGDQRFLEPYSGLYWQISGGNQEPYRSRSLWERSLKAPTPHIDNQIHTYDSTQFPDEELRVLERNVILPGSKTSWRFQIAQSREALDTQNRAVRATLIPSLALLGLGLIILAALQTFYGLWPLRHIRRAIAAMRGGQNRRVDAPLPLEVQPMVDELNALLAHNEKQAEEARLHAGNLAHALKTPLTVLVNSATSSDTELAETVRREAASHEVMVIPFPSLLSQP